MKIKPLFDRIVLRQINLTKENNDSCLVLPETSQEKPLIGEVLEIGDGVTGEDKNIEMVVEKGDKVLFSKYAGNEFKVNGKEFIIIRQSDILAILKD